MGAAHHERTEGRGGRHDGSGRGSGTRGRAIELKAPRVRDSGHPPRCWNRAGGRAERALLSAVVQEETYVRGVSAREVEELV